MVDCETVVRLYLYISLLCVTAVRQWTLRWGGGPVNQKNLPYKRVFDKKYDFK